jgi:hypothetical protein
MLLLAPARRATNKSVFRKTEHSGFGKPSPSGHDYSRWEDKKLQLSFIP